mmetsp:Transcript_41631/g.93940  ORF Transcript_41631/g.93940 Transcript_41631/m.93940 type:complete len:226 (+) Transcript_41631:780-1457(+)
MSAASFPTSVRNPLRMGVRKLSRSSSSSARWRAARPLAHSPCSSSSSASIWLSRIRSASWAHSKQSERPPSDTAFMNKSMCRTWGWWMMGSAILSGSLAPPTPRMLMRSLAYHRLFWKATSAAATPCRAVPTLEVLMKVNMCPIPLFSAPMSHPLAPLNSSWQVGDPWHPIFCSSREQVTPLGTAPVAIPGPRHSLGTRKRERPLVPLGLAAAGGASGSRARTQW